MISTGILLNDTLIVAPPPPASGCVAPFQTPHDCLDRRCDKDVSSRQSDPARSFYMFVWRSDPSKPLIDYYRLTSVTFGVAASCQHNNGKAKCRRVG